MEKSDREGLSGLSLPGWAGDPISVAWRKAVQEEIHPSHARPRQNVRCFLCVPPRLERVEFCLLGLALSFHLLLTRRRKKARKECFLAEVLPE